MNNLDITFTGLGHQPVTHMLSGSGGDDAPRRFIEGMTRTERSVLRILCEQIVDEVRRKDNESERRNP